MAKIRGAGDSCDACSQRRVKCDKTRPACEGCTSRGEACNYPQFNRRNTHIWNARTDSRYHNAVPDKDGFYHCGITPCKHKATKNISKHFEKLDCHIKPYRCRFSSCRDKKFGSTKQLKQHTGRDHNHEPTRCDIKDSPLPSNSSSVPDAMSLNNTNTPITEKLEEVDSSGGDLSDNEDMHSVSSDGQFYESPHQSGILGSGQAEVLPERFNSAVSDNSLLDEGTEYRPCVTCRDDAVASYSASMQKLYYRLQFCQDPSSKDNIENLRSVHECIGEMVKITLEFDDLCWHIEHDHRITVLEKPQDMQTVRHNIVCKQ